MIDDIIKHVETKAEILQDIVSFASEINISRRNWTAYPAGHPVITASLERLDIIIRRILQKQSGVSLGISKDSILLGEELIEKGNPVCRSVASALFERGISSLIIRSIPTFDEIGKFLSILVLKREEILSKGGIESVWQEEGIHSLDIIGIRYDRFTGTSSLSSQPPSNSVESIWEKLAKTISQGEQFALSDDYKFLTGELTPELLAETINSRYINTKGATPGVISSSLPSGIFAIIQDVIKHENSAVSTDTTIASDKYNSQYRELCSFFRALDPRLRRQILDGFCIAHHANADEIESLFSSLGPALIQETYTSASDYSNAPPLLQGVLKKLLPKSSDIFTSFSVLEDTRSKIRSLLQEHEDEAFLPPDYFKQLNNIIKFTPEAHHDQKAYSQLLESLEQSTIETRSSEIILQLVITDLEGEPEKLIENLTDMCIYFLELGNYDQVLRILNQAADPAFPPETRRAMGKAFSRAEFLEEILSGLNVWGKSRYEHVTMLIKIVGRPFIEPLLNRLAEEDNMSLRRFIMDRILSFGDTAIPALIARLTDSRWYVLRNVIVMLRSIGSGKETEHLRSLLKHPNIKVRNEAMKSLLLAGDPVAQRIISRDLDSTDHEVLLSAIHMVEKNSPDEVVAKLLSLLFKGGFSQLECEIKSASIHALSETGRSDVLPELARLLAMRSLLSFRQLNRLKLDIVKSMERYPVGDILPILQKLAKGSDEISKQASDVLKNIRNRTI